MGYLISDELLIRYLTETVAAEEIEQIEQWYSVSIENQKILEHLYLALQASSRLKVIQTANPDKALGDLKNRIEQQEKKKRRKIVIRRLQQVAAILFLPALFLSLWLSLQKDEMQVQYFEMHSNPGMVTSLELPDGSKVWLNGGSSLRYPNVFKGRHREVKMSGQGYFEIVQNSKHPFLVKTGESFLLEVLGTSFNISAYDDENIIETTLVEGSIQLKLLQDGKMVQRILKPNEKVVYTKNNESESVKSGTVLSKNDLIISPKKDINTDMVKIASVDPKYDIAWKDQKILFKDHPMEQVIRTLGRYYNVEFVVKNTQVMNSEITGKFDNEQLSQVMEYLKIASGIKYNIIPVTVGNGEIKTEVVEIWK
jgi:ferric-dicitrate binding protein FerR (iron transport regulator)